MQWFFGGLFHGLAGADVEAAAVQGALDEFAIQTAERQGRVFMSAGVVACVDGSADIGQQNESVLMFYAKGLARWEVRQRGDFDEGFWHNLAGFALQLYYSTWLMDYLERIRQARVYAVAERTPLQQAPQLSARLGCDVWLKREDLQRTFSFKLRGAYNKISGLDEAQRAHGVIAASAGNHAQGVALAASKLGLDAVIVMPRTTPPIKVNAVRALGATIVLEGDDYDAACQHAMQRGEQEQRVFVHPYDDPEVIAGQATIAVEICEQCPVSPDAVFIPVGGGGLLAGMGTWLRHATPDTQVIGVEPEDAPSMARALAQDDRVRLEQVGLFADGAAVRQVGAETFKLARACTDTVVLVSIDEICAAIKDIFEETRVLVEPAGALAVAGIKRHLQSGAAPGQTLVAVNSGANINFDRLRHVAERAELGEGHEGLFAVTIPESPGSFRKFCEAVGEHSISEFNYRYADSREAQIFVGIKFRDAAAEKPDWVARLRACGYAVADLSDSEMAKLHLRYLVGGHTGSQQREILYRFEFPERPGALLEFLSRMGQDWNISLFHYRNHGAAYGRVLVGMQVPESGMEEWRGFLETLGYQYHEETDNAACRRFLG